ncbi:hypothetical protein PPL_04145 [Heterostelium album PN500]|uniref:CBS domain-containing protein n=1 Tax=Heterostelium pallidum (strain ATCC 26659 / Pp 5 / PN500) TaxID=670386 RepID=D3B654_HETP5|nr:hypothetical protein PPL_04145 [Heterostelium album PN500]EFA83352.1 hypothetical protein PPL_04145 [Heterostelium album PN500]|eukprot:XP_020435469.1 hypothetical protein PPL_04145 [Heterostelium album PN500]
MELLETLKASSPVFPNDLSRIIFVKKEDSIEKGFKVLIDNNILAAPVYDEKEKRYVSFFSMVDLIYEILDIVERESLPKGDISSVMTMLNDKNLFCKQRITDIANISKREPFIIVNAEKRLDEVARLMSKNKIHRVAVLDSRGELCNVISLSRIIECASQLFGIDNQLTKIGEKTISELNLGRNEVITISSDKRALDAFKTIAELGISGIGVLDSGGHLCGVISDHDLNVIKSHCQYLSLLYLPICEYLDAMKKLTNSPKHVITCTYNETFKEVTQRIAENKIHRIFIVNEENKLKGVISLLDILEQIVWAQKLHEN